MSPNIQPRQHSQSIVQKRRKANETLLALAMERDWISPSSAAARLLNSGCYYNEVLEGDYLLRRYKHQGYITEDDLAEAMRQAEEGQKTQRWTLGSRYSA